MIKVEGQKKADIKLFALSTCIWCKKTKQLLDDNNLEYNYLFMDKLEGDEKKKAKEELKKWNKSCSYPTIVINKKCIVGFEEDEILAELEK